MVDRNINIVHLLTPKAVTVFLYDDDTVRQGLETFRHYGYTSIPVVNKHGGYMGCVTEGDFLRYIMQKGNTDVHLMEKNYIRDIMRPDFGSSVFIHAPAEEVVNIALRQNYVPVIDDRGYLSGIITRKSVIEFLASKAL